MKKNLRTILEAVSGVILLLALLLSVAIFCAKVQNRPFFLFGKSAMWILTDSMEDTIPAQSYILVRQATADDVREGMVIVFYSDDPQIAGALNTHRVVAVRPDGSFLTKGDHASAPDTTPVRRDAVVAVYEKNLPALTAFGRFMLSPGGLVLIFLCALLISAVFFLPGILRTLTKTPATESAEAEKEDAHARLLRERYERELARLQEEHPQKKDENSEKNP